MKEILVVCGPTASGKTAFALKLAGTKPSSIISADSRQIYRGLTILTGKDIPTGFYKEKDYYTDGTVRLFGFDLCEPNETFSAAEYSDRMRAILENETEKDRQVIIVGGTGFYLQAITQPASLAKVPPNEKLRQKLNQLSVMKLQQELKKINSEKLNSMNPSDIKNPRRLIRAIEVAQAPTGSNPVASDSLFTFSWIGLRLPLEQIKERITSRTASRFAAAINEVKTLLVTYPDQSLPIYTSLGIKPILRYLAKEITDEELRKLWVTDEVNYAKRQMTWFKKQEQIIWYDQIRLNKWPLTTTKK